MAAAGDTATYLENKSFAETNAHRDIQLSAMMPGDVNPAHEEFAKSDVFHKIVAHGTQGDRAKKLMTRG
jgi:acyl dehydratase